MKILASLGPYTIFALLAIFFISYGNCYFDKIDDIDEFTIIRQPDDNESETYRNVQLMKVVGESKYFLEGEKILYKFEIEEIEYHSCFFKLIRINLNDNAELLLRFHTPKWAALFYEILVDMFKENLLDTPSFTLNRMISFYRTDGNEVNVKVIGQQPIENTPEEDEFVHQLSSSEEATSGVTNDADVSVPVVLNFYKISEENLLCVFVTVNGVDTIRIAFTTLIARYTEVHDTKIGVIAMTRKNACWLFVLTFADINDAVNFYSLISNYSKSVKSQRALTMMKPFLEAPIKS